MTPKWILPLLAAAAAGVLGFGITRHVVCRPTGPGLDRLQDVSFLTRELGLSDAQAGQIKALHSDLSAKLNDCCARHCASRARLGQALADETNGTVRAEAIIVEMGRAYEESERAALDHIRRVRAILNIEQRRQFDAMLSNCMCRACPMHE